MAGDLKTPEEWASGKDVRTTFANVMQVNGHLTVAYAEKVLAKAVADETEVQQKTPHLEILKWACDELGQGIARAIRRNGMVPAECRAFIKAPSEHGDPISSAVSIGAKAYSVASGKPEDYILYLTATCKQVMAENLTLREENATKNRMIDRLREEIPSERWSELAGEVPGWQEWWE